MSCWAISGHAQSYWINAELVRAVHRAPYEPLLSPLQTSIAFHTRWPSHQPSQITIQTNHKLASADFSIVTMEKRSYLVFVEPRSIGKCGTEVEIMSKFSYKSSRTKKWNYRILISTAMLTSWVFKLQNNIRRRIFEIEFLPENPNRSFVLYNSLKHRKHVNIPVDATVIYQAMT